MGEISVRQYTENDKAEWDNLVSESKNGTFLFYRDFMEYHSDRFEDHSLMFYKDNDLIALFPANKKGTTIYSHSGLSYGGWLIKPSLRCEEYFALVIASLEFLKSEGFVDLELREIPFIYHSELCQEESYTLSKLNAQCLKTDSYFVMDASVNYKPNRNRKRAIKTAKENQAILTESGLDEFWQSILTPNLQQRFGVNPVHSLEEIQQLQKRFPERIRYFGVEIDGRLQAGAVLFISNQVAHFQYSSGTEDRDNGALDFLFDYIIRKYQNKNYISFGSSSTDDSLKINAGLAYWKESFGARIIPQRTYGLSLNQINLTSPFFL